MVLQELDRRYGSKYSLYTKSHTHTFLKADLASDQAQQIGCEPDFDAYEGGAMRRSPPRPTLKRSCGGHIHLGGDFKCPDFVAALFAELFIGVRGGIASLPSDPRAEWYGKPGIFRPKPYGIEYRSPNNKWALTSSGIEMAGAYGLRCATYLTQTDPVVLQRAFRKIPWVTVRKWMMGSKRTAISKARYKQIYTAASAAGVPV